MLDLPRGADQKERGFWEGEWLGHRLVFNCISCMLGLTVAMARSSVIAFLFYFFASYPANAGKETWTQCVEDKSQSLYNFTTKYLNGKPVSLKEYRGVVTLVLNVATYCKFTYQYPHLNALMQAFPAGKYKCGFSILAFPCNQFMHQEPGADYREIFNGLIFVRPGFGFKPFFPLFQKIEVNGKNEDQMYTFLKVIYWLFLGLSSDRLYILHKPC